MEIGDPAIKVETGTDADLGKGYRQHPQLVDAGLHLGEAGLVSTPPQIGQLLGLPAPPILQGTGVAVSVLDGKGRDPAKVFGLGSVLECLVEADLEGVRTHGAVRLPSYWSRLRSGLISARPRQRIVTDWAAAALLDAGHGPGPLGGRGGMEIAIARARGAGVGAGAARKGNHVGLLGWYVEDAAREGVLALAFGNAPASMAAPGGFTPLLGTNPLGAGGDLRRS